MGFTPKRWCQRKPKQKADPKARPLRFKNLRVKANDQRFRQVGVSPSNPDP